MPRGRLYDSKRLYNPNTVLVPHGVLYDRFAQADHCSSACRTSHYCAQKGYSLHLAYGHLVPVGPHCRGEQWQHVATNGKEGAFACFCALRGQRRHKSMVLKRLLKPVNFALVLVFALFARHFVAGCRSRGAHLRELP